MAFLQIGGHILLGQPVFTRIFLILWDLVGPVLEVVAEVE